MCNDHVTFILQQLLSPGFAIFVLFATGIGIALYLAMKEG